jgi:hypothetical protein
VLDITLAGSEMPTTSELPGPSEYTWFTPFWRFRSESDTVADATDSENVRKELPPTTATNKSIVTVSTSNSTDDCARDPTKSTPMD